MSNEMKTVESELVRVFGACQAPQEVVTATPEGWSKANTAWCWQALATLAATAAGRRFGKAEAGRVLGWACPGVLLSNRGGYTAQALGAVRGKSAAHGYYVADGAAVSQAIACETVRGIVGSTDDAITRNVAHAVVSLDAKALARYWDKVVCPSVVRAYKVTQSPLTDAETAILADPATMQGAVETCARYIARYPRLPGKRG